MDDKSLAVIMFDGIHLLLPQQAVVTIEMSDDIENSATAPGAIGTLKAETGEWPVYALDTELRPQASCPSHYKYCVAVSRGDEAVFSIMCEEVGAVEVEHDDEIKPLQVCMRPDKSPIQSLLLKDETLMLVSDVDSLQQYLSLEVAA